MEDLVERFRDRIFRLAYRVLGDGPRSEVATADAPAMVWSRCGSWRREARAGANSPQSADKPDPGKIN
jgi:hypothetical protein